MHVGVGKHETTVDEQNFIVLLNCHAVTANFAQATEEVNTYV